MNELLTERSESILRVQFNRPTKKNAMTAAMYTGLADLLNEADQDDNINVVLLHGAGDSFTAGNDLEDFAKNPPGSGDSPQARLIKCADPIQQAAGRRSTRGRDRRRNHHSDPLRLRIRCGEREVSNPIYQSRARAGVRIQFLASKTNRISPGCRSDHAGRAFRCGSGERAGLGDCCSPRYQSLGKGYRNSADTCTETSCGAEDL